MIHILSFEQMNENWVEHIDDKPYRTNFSGLSGDDERYIQKGQVVRVFRNLNTKTVKNRWDKEGIKDFREEDDVLWSIRDKKGKPIHHSYNIWLKNCTFPVVEGKFGDKKGSGRRGVLQSGMKEVHAFVEGEMVTWKDFNIDTSDWVSLYYNPYVLDAFVVADTPKNRELGIAKMEVISADEVILSEDFINGKKIPMVIAKNPITEEHIMNNPTKDNWKEYI